MMTAKNQWLPLIDSAISLMNVNNDPETGLGPVKLASWPGCIELVSVTPGSFWVVLLIQLTLFSTAWKTIFEMRGRGIHEPFVTWTC